MTTLTTVISMIPMAMGLGSGTEMMSGMAIIIIGGLVASTLLILVLMPVFYLLVYGRSKKERREPPGKNCISGKRKKKRKKNLNYRRTIHLKGGQNAPLLYYILRHVELSRIFPNSFDRFFL